MDRCYICDALAPEGADVCRGCDSASGLALDSTATDFERELTDPMGGRY